MDGYASKDKRNRVGYPEPFEGKRDHFPLGTEGVFCGTSGQSTILYPPGRPPGLKPHPPAGAFNRIMIPSLIYCIFTLK